jgi:hypothetical protein
VFNWRPAPIPIAPDEDEWAGAARWRIDVPTIPTSASVSDVFLKIVYQGDVARLYRGSRLIDDDFWNGIPWTIGLREVSGAGGGEADADNEWRKAKSDWELRILPLPRKYPLYLEQSGKVDFGATGVADSVKDVQLVVQYRLILQPSGGPVIPAGKYFLLSPTFGGFASPPVTLRVPEMQDFAGLQYRTGPEPSCFGEAR